MILRRVSGIRNTRTLTCTLTIKTLGKSDPQMMTLHALTGILLLIQSKIPL